MLWKDPRAKSIIETLRNAGHSDLQINNAFVELESGGTVEDAHLIMKKIAFPSPALLELELFLINLEHRRLQRMVLESDPECADVYPDGALAWPSNY